MLLQLFSREIEQQLAREFKYCWWGEKVFPDQSNHYFMRSIIFRAACVVAILCNPWIASSQQYYVVVGAFAAEEKASEFKGYLPLQFMDTSYTLTEQKNVLHFYILKTSDKESAVSKAMNLKKEVQSWRPEDTRKVVITPEGEISGEIMDRQGPDVKHEEITESSQASASATGSANAGAIPAKPSGKYFRFRIESPEGSPLQGDVHRVNFDNGRALAAYHSNTSVDLLYPGQTKEPMAVVCGLFGYKEIYKYIDYADPSLTDEEAYVDSAGSWVIPYKLERLEKGDVSLMHNVSFYKDAAVMRNSSMVDLDELVNMMHSNPYYEVTIHAHCNGKNKREIIALGPDKNFFDVAGSVKLYGSARDLTASRAEAIRAYLVAHGIDPERTKVFAWGASDRLVKENSPHADMNDRIEIEITRD